MTEPTEQEFQDALDGQDELGVVVRAHIHIEHHLIALIEALMPCPDQINKLELHYSKRVHLSVALGLKQTYRRPLLTLGSIRNHFAHKLGAKITKNLVDTLYKSFCPEDKDLIRRGLEATAQQLNERAPRLKALEPKVQFIFMVVTLRSMLLAARHELEQRNNV